MQRPTSVTVFAVLNLVFAGLGILGLLFALTALFSASGTNNPAEKVMQNSPILKMWTMAAIPLGLAGCVAEIASGIGMLSLKPWARNLAIGYAIFAIVMCIVGTTMNALFFLGPMMEMAQSIPGPQGAALYGAAIGGTFGSCLSVIYPGLLLFFMFRSNVVAAFQGRDDEDEFGDFRR